MEAAATEQLGWCHYAQDWAARRGHTSLIFGTLTAFATRRLCRA